MRSDPLALLVRVLCKCYEILLRCVTFVRRSGEGDPSQILLDYRTPEQLAGQQVLDATTLAPPGEGELLVVIPFRDRWDLTHSCLTTLVTQKLPAGIRMRVALVDNGSCETKTQSGLQGVASDFSQLNPQTVVADYPFNFSRLNNDGVRAASTNETRWVLFLNNDVELLDDSIVARMLTLSHSCPKVGPIGCTLLYQDRSIQHLFAAVGVKIIAAHPLKGSSYQKTPAWFQAPARCVGAVTGAVMLVRAADFKQLGMFDETLPTLGQDIDLCLKFVKQGLFPAVITATDVIHHESKTKKSGFAKAEVERMEEVWSQEFKSYSLMHDRFSRWSEKPVLKMGWEPRYPWRLLLP